MSVFMSRFNGIGSDSRVEKSLFTTAGTFSGLADLIAGGRSIMD
jgi:hypothetical protein